MQIYKKFIKNEYFEDKFEYGVLLLAGARNVSSLQKKTEICSLRSPLFFITEINGKDRKKQKFLPAAGYGNANVNLNVNLNLAR